MKRRTFIVQLSAFSAAALGFARSLFGAKEAGPCGAPPPPKPAQASGAEGLPPLPLPATPQRRTEKKNPPRPPVILVKIATDRELDWATDLNDANNLLIWMKANLGVNFTYDQKPLSQIDLEAGDVPVLYRTGHNSFAFTPGERERLRKYLLRGGMMIFDACCGRQEFVDSARQEIAAILPDRPLKPIGLDHAVFNCFYQNAGLVHFTPSSNMKSPAPSGIEGVEVACRMAVVFSPHDLSCGWDMHTHTTPGNTYIESDDGLKIGANFIAYATATRDLGVTASAAKSYIDADPTRTDKFRAGQVVHEGDWNPDPTGMQNLLDSVGRGTALKISFATEPVKIEGDALTRYPFLYITGHDDFVWSEAQVAMVRKHLVNGGFMLGEACCGRSKFDAAFRREMGKVFAGISGEGARLAPLPLTHPIYTIQNTVKSVQYTEAAQFRFGGKAGDQPRLEAAAINGRTAVVYSPLALNVGWRLKTVPYAVGYAPKSALDLGVNIVMYAVGA